jgi:hypothetical protein
VVMQADQKEDYPYILVGNSLCILVTRLSPYWDAALLTYEERCRTVWVRVCPVILAESHIAHSRFSSAASCAAAK